MYLRRIVWLGCLMAGVVFTQAPPIAKGDHMRLHGVMVPMRDGARMATDVYLPVRGGKVADEKFPTILKITPYNRESPANQIQAQYWVSQGYAAVFQDMRSRYGSDGAWTQHAAYGKDGYDTVEWIARQPWSNGKIGTYGGSFEALTQHTLAVENPPHLTTMIPSFCHLAWGSSGGMRYMGTFDIPQLIAQFTILGHTSKQALQNSAIRDAIEQAAFQLPGYLDDLPLKKGTTPLALIPDYEETILELQSHADNDDYWTARGYHMSEQHFKGYSGAPALNIAGWYDAWSRQQLEAYSRLVELGKRGQRIVVGPWTHGGAGVSFAGEVDFGPQSDMDGLLRVLEADVRNVRTPEPSTLSPQSVRGGFGSPLYSLWFDRYLRDSPNRLLDGPPIWLFVMGGGDGRKNGEGRLNHGGRWRSEPNWPLARAASTPYFFQAGGGLKPDKPGASAPTSYAFDPSDPVATIGGTIWTYPRSAPARTGVTLRDSPPTGALDQRCRLDIYPCKNELPLSARNDVLVFQTEPLSHDIEVTGPIAVKLWVSSSARDTDFAAKLIDVHPSSPDFPAGFAMNLSEGIQRARYRRSLERAEPMEPGKLYPLEVVLYPTSNLFKVGHRIRVDISSSSFPRFDVNPNTGGPLGKDRIRQVAINSIYHDPEHLSHVVLPVVPVR